MAAFFAATVAYFFGLWPGRRILAHHDIELPRFSRWLILNTFAILLAYLAAIPF